MKSFTARLVRIFRSLSVFAFFITPQLSLAADQGGICFSAPKLIHQKLLGYFPEELCIEALSTEVLSPQGTQFLNVQASPTEFTGSYTLTWLRSPLGKLDGFKAKLRSVSDDEEPCGHAEYRNLELRFKFADDQTPDLTNPVLIMSFESTSDACHYRSKVFEYVYQRSFKSDKQFAAVVATELE